jgi:outer membrane protein OmpA-like peptidoglycan-associated protein
MSKNNDIRRGEGMMTPRKLILWILVAAFSVITAFYAFPAYAGHNADIITINPATDGGKYINLHQSNTMPQWSYNVGGMFDYGFEPLEYADAAGNRRRGIVDDLLMLNVNGAIAWTDWWLMGINVPLALWETFYNPNAAAVAVQKQTFYGKLGDARVEMKFRLLDIERYHVGLSIVPFFYFPTGKEEYFLGNGMWSPGGLIAFDADIKNRVSLALNVGYRNYAKTRYDVNNTNAVIDDTMILNGGVNVRITDSWAVLGEVLSESVLSGLWKNQLQNPAEFLVAGRFTPQKYAKGLAVTVGGGRGITTGIGSPDFRALVGVNYRHLKEAAPPPPVEVEAAVEEKIVITQKIHFEFDRAVIRPISYPILDDVASLLQRNTQIRRVRVEGHTDWIGSDAYNQALSERRANAVRNYLIQKGIEPDRLEAVGYGESRPIADNESVKGRARNRRTEFTVTSVAPY